MRVSSSICSILIISAPIALFLTDVFYGDPKARDSNLITRYITILANTTSILFARDSTFLASETTTNPAPMSAGIQTRGSYANTKSLPVPDLPPSTLKTTTKPVITATRSTARITTTTKPATASTTKATTKASTLEPPEAPTKASTARTISTTGLPPATTRTTTKPLTSTVRTTPTTRSTKTTTSPPTTTVTPRTTRSSTARTVATTKTSPSTLRTTTKPPTTTTIATTRITTKTTTSPPPFTTTVTTTTSAARTIATTTPIKTVPPVKVFGKAIKPIPTPGENILDFEYDIVKDKYSQSPENGLFSQVYDVKNIRRIRDTNTNEVYFGLVDGADHGTISWRFDKDLNNNKIGRVDIEVRDDEEYSYNGKAIATFCIADECWIIRRNSVTSIYDTKHGQINVIFILTGGDAQIFRRSLGEEAHFPSWKLTVHTMLGKPIRLTPTPDQGEIDFSYDIVSDRYSQIPTRGFISQASEFNLLERVEDTDENTVYLTPIEGENQGNISWFFNFELIDKPVKLVIVKIRGVCKKSAAKAEICLTKKCWKISQSTTIFHKPTGRIMRITRLGVNTEVPSLFVKIVTGLGEAIKLTLKPGESELHFTYDIINDKYSQSPEKGFISQASEYNLLTRVVDTDKNIVYLTPMKGECQGNISWLLDLESIGKPVEAVIIKVEDFSEFNNQTSAKAQCCTTDKCWNLSMNTPLQILEPNSKTLKISIELVAGTQLFKRDFVKGMNADSLSVIVLTYK